MIRMIKGTYGLTANGTVEAMTPSSGPFQVNEEREAELIAAGVAEKVETADAPDPYAGMKMPELREAASALGIDTGSAKTRKAIIALLEAASGRETGPGAAE